MNLEKQKELILSGKMYNDLTCELVAARENTVFLTNEYNASFGKPPEVREAILKKLLKSVGKGVHFEPNFRCEFGYNISIGNNFYANFDCIMLDGGGIEIGDNVLFGPRVGIYTSNHAADAWERVHGACYAKPVKIGSNGRLFGSVTGKDISEALKKQFSIEVDKRKISLKTEVTGTGSYEAVIKVHPEITSTIKVEITAG